jgi:acyl-coenzyme A thioesterase PaaI-like protein
MISPLTKANLYLNYFGFFKVPFIWLARPKILHLDDERVEVKIPIRRRTKNHLNSMYFGVLAVGADVAGGFMAMSKAQDSGRKVSLAFKAVEGQFLKRPEADVHFICEDGKQIDQMLKRTFDTGERVNEAVKITAICPSLHGNEPMAEFYLTLSLKRKGD